MNRQKAIFNHFYVTNKFHHNSMIDCVEQWKLQCFDDNVNGVISFDLQQI